MQEKEISVLFRKIRNGFWEKEESNVIQGQLADNLLKRLIIELEDYKLDFKEIIPEDKKKTGKLISAISNEGGGAIVYGVSNDRKILGIQDLDSISERIIRIARDKCNPVPEIRPLKIITSKKIEILIALIPRPTKSLVSYDGVYYKRIADSTEKISDIEFKNRSEEINQIRNNFSVIWENTSDLIPVEILGLDRGSKQGGYNEFYQSRDEDTELDRIMSNIFNESRNECSPRHILIKGPPLSGKSRLVYEWFQNQRKIDILIPKYDTIDNTLYTLPHNSKITNKKIVYLDDINLYMKNKKFIPFFKQLISNVGLVIVSTCRSGFEFEKLLDMLLKDHQIDIEHIFKQMEMKSINEDLAKKIAEEMNIDWNDVEFNGTIGSIPLKLNEMRRRYNHEISIKAKTLLKILKYIQLTGMLFFKNLYQIELIKTISKLDRFELNLKSYQLNNLFEELEKWEFIIKYDRDFILIDSVYTERIIDPEMEISLSDYKKLKLIFAGNIPILMLLAHHLENISRNLIRNKIDYLLEIVSIYIGIIESKEVKNEGLIASIGKELGDIYYSLAWLIDTKKYLLKSISSYKQSLLYFSLEEFPLDFAMLNYNLSNSYEHLVTIEDFSININKSIEYARIALEIFVKHKNSFSSSLAQVKLGNSLSMLAEVIPINQFNNCKSSIEYYENALEFFTKSDYPNKYAMICNNLGTVYSILVTLSEPMENFQKSIDYYNKSLEFRTIETKPNEYSSTQYNLGILYNKISQIGPVSLNKDKQTEVLKIAISHFKNALKFRKKENAPILFSKTMINISSTLFTLFDKEKKIGYVTEGIKISKEALKIVTKEEYPFHYVTAINSLANGYCLLAENNIDSISNLKTAIELFEEIIKVNIERNDLLSNADIMNNLGLAYLDLAKLENKNSNCKKAISILTNALEQINQMGNPIKIFVTKRNLTEAKEFCDE